MGNIMGLPWEIDGVVTVNGAKVSAGIYRTIPIDATPDENDEVCRVEWPYAPLIVRAVNAHDALVAALKRVEVIASLVTVRQVIEAGDAAIEAAGLNPWAMNEGLADGTERVGTYFIDSALLLASGASE
jgi:hypothetical protein